MDTGRCPPVKNPTRCQAYFSANNFFFLKKNSPVSTSTEPRAEDDPLLAHILCPPWRSQTTNWAFLVDKQNPILELSFPPNESFLIPV